MPDLVTASDLRKLCPALPRGTASALAASMCRRFPVAGVDTPNRIAAILGQMAAESGLEPLTENLSYTADRIREVFDYVSIAEAKKLARKPEALAERVYGTGNPKKAKELGNVEEGDAFRFRGRTPLQITGKSNYATAGADVGIDLVDDPDLANDPDVSVAVVLSFWTEHGLNGLADAWKIDAISRKVNGGAQARAARRNFSDKALKIFSGDRDDAVAAAPSKADVRSAQKRLAELKYPVGDVDGKPGKIFRAALISFQEDNGLDASGELDEATTEALPDAAPRRLSEKRTKATLKDLHADGDTMATAVQNGKKAVGIGSTALAAAGAAYDALPSPSDAIDHAQSAVEHGQTLVETAKTVRETVGDETLHLVLSKLPEALAWIGGVGLVGGCVFGLVHGLGLVYVRAKADGKVL